LGGFAAAACFVITDAGIPAAGAAAAGADTGVAGGLLKTAGLGVGTGTEEDAAGIQRQGAGIDFAANDAGHVCVDRHVRSTEGAALPGADAVVLFGAGFRYLGVAADVEAGAGGGPYGSRGGGECLGGGHLRLRKVGGGHRKHAL